MGETGACCLSPRTDSAGLPKLLQGAEPRAPQEDQTHPSCAPVPRLTPPLTRRSLFGDNVHIQTSASILSGETDQMDDIKNCFLMYSPSLLKVWLSVSFFLASRTSNAKAGDSTRVTHLTPVSRSPSPGRGTSWRPGALLVQRTANGTILSLQAM